MSDAVFVRALVNMLEQMVDHFDVQEKSEQNSVIHGMIHARSGIVITYGPCRVWTFFFKKVGPYLV